MSTEHATHNAAECTAVFQTKWATVITAFFVSFNSAVDATYVVSIATAYRSADLSTEHATHLSAECTAVIHSKWATIITALVYA